MPQGKSIDPRELVQWKQQVLLVDASQRRDVRAASLRHAGMVVHCALNGSSAAALWEPEKYELVLFEFTEAELDVRPFCEKLMRVSPRQKIGMYCETAPFIVAPRRGLLTSATAAVAATTEAVGAGSNPLSDALAAAAQRFDDDAGSAAEGRAASSTSRPAAQQPISDRRQRSITAAARQRNGRHGLAQAAQQIAALRWRGPNSVAPVRPFSERPNLGNHDVPRPDSPAAIAARVLGGEQ